MSKDFKEVQELNSPGMAPVRLLEERSSSTKVEQRSARRAGIWPAKWLAAR